MIVIEAKELSIKDKQTAINNKIFESGTGTTNLMMN